MQEKIEMNRHSQQAFTLIELMIVVAIIGILASISISAYKNYVARSTHTAGVVEIRAGQIIMETLLYEGISVSLPTEINLTGNTNNCSEITATSNAALSTGSITCTLDGNSVINNKVITLGRDANGFWSCSSTAASIYSGNCTGT